MAGGGLFCVLWPTKQELAPQSLPSVPRGQGENAQGRLERSDGAELSGLDARHEG